MNGRKHLTAGEVLSVDIVKSMIFNREDNYELGRNVQKRLSM